MSSVRDIISAAQITSDKVNDPSLDDVTFWVPSANEAIENLWQVITNANRDFFVTYADTGVTPNFAAVTAAAPFIDLSVLLDDLGGWMMRKLRLVEKDPTFPRPLKVPRRTLNTKNYQTWPVAYIPEGQLLLLDPTLQAPGNYRVWYVSGPSTLLASDDLPAEIVPYREYLETYLTVKALGQAEQDASSFASMLSVLKDSVIASVVDQNAADADHIQDTLAEDELLMQSPSRLFGWPWPPIG